MMVNSGERRRRGLLIVFSILTAVLTVLAYWYVNMLVPFMMDDEWYSTRLYDEEKIKGIKDIFKAQVWHYMNWGGRSITHTILQLTILAGDSFANVANTVMAVITGIIVTGMTETITKIKRTFFNRLLSVTIVMGLLLGFNANWKMSMFWQAGSANYLYITVFILLFMWAYLREIPYDCLVETEDLWGIKVWILPLGIIAGWSNENMGPVAFIFAVFTMVILKRQKRFVKGWMVEGAIASALGSAACILAPGNFVRSAQVANTHYGILWQCFLHGYQEATAAVVYLFVPVIILVILYILAKKVFYIVPGREVDVFCVLALLSWGAMVLSPHYPDRATYGTMVLIIVAIITICQKIIDRRPDLRKYLWLGAFLIWLRGMYYLGEFTAISWGWIL